MARYAYETDATEDAALQAETNAANAVIAADNAQRAAQIPPLPPRALYTLTTFTRFIMAQAMDRLVSQSFGSEQQRVSSAYASADATRRASVRSTLGISP